MSNDQRRVGDRNRLEERLESEWPALIPAHPPAQLFGDVKREIRDLPQIRPGRFVRFALTGGLAAAVVMLAVALMYGTTYLGQAARTPQPKPDAPAGDLMPGSVAEVVEPFALAADRQVLAGQLVFVVAGPELHDGTPSYLLQHWGDLESGIRPASDFGWLSASQSAALLRPIEVGCPPAEPSLVEVAALQPFERPLCYGDQALSFGPVVATKYSVGGATELWISLDGSPSLTTALAAYPDAGVDLPFGSWRRVTGHFDDTSAASCGSPIEVARCQQRFVITSVTETAPPADVLRGEWRTIADAPIAGRADHVMAWTGSEVLVWGGVSAAEETPANWPRGGAAYDPATDSWRIIPDAPMAGRSYPVAAWSGSELLVWGGYVDDEDGRRLFLADGAAYDPAANHWRMLPESPLTATEAVGGWVAGRFVVITDVDAARYDPGADRWEPIEAAPVRPGSRVTAVVGDRLVVVAYGDGSTGRVEAAMLDPDGRWSTVDVPLDPIDAGAGIVGTDRLAVMPAVGLAFDPSSGAWHTLTQCNEAANGATWTGSLIIGVTGAYDVDQDACLQLPAAPPRAAPFQATNRREFAAAVWTGAEYVTWSGNVGDALWPPSDGAVFRPADRRQ